MNIVVIDNYDSFTYNLVQYLGELGEHPAVIRNDAATVDEVAEMKPDAIVISPGPGTPDDAGISNDVIRKLAESIPILGVCLGHQCIGAVYGARIVQAPAILHGKTSEISHDDSPIFKGIPSPLIATRYHSLVIDSKSVPKDLIVTAQTEDGTIMAVQHKDLPVYGVQFHPESILTQYGHEMLKNFLSLISR
jgi:anthranilate synthase/aminodeoxychorismate synthase-like glutamine amidotransferase